jgi:Surface antigen
MILELLKKKFKLWLLGLLTPVILGLFGLIVFIIVSSSIFWFLNQNQRNQCSEVQPTQEETVSGPNGDWTKSGTKEYQNAKNLWDTILASPYYKGKVEGYGMVAGMIGNAASESAGFHFVDTAQGHYGTDPKATELSQGAVPDGGGGGLFQFTPYDDFAPLGDKKWLDVKAQVNFLFEAKMGANRSDMTYQQFIREGNDEKAHPDLTADWFLRRVERPADPEATVKKRKTDAQKAYQLFRDSSDKSDDLNLHEGVQQTDENGMYNRETACTTYDERALADGTGKVPSVSTKIWSNDSLDKDLKKYAIDPEKIGLKYNNPQGWLEQSGQCVDLTESLGPKIWGVDMVVIHGNGKDQTASWQAKYGGSLSKTPTAGAIFSTVAGSGTPDYGHTGIVSHVFEDGSVLLIEQNVKGYSGDAANKPDTWDYRLITKQEATGTDYTYYSVPGHQPNLKMKE